MLRWLSIALGGWGLVILFCIPAMARTSHDIHGGNCVAYARDVTGVQLDGNAAAWWPHAEGRYERGHTPQVGAILVFKPYGGMHVGHVAVVSRVVGDREVLVDQANWVRGRVTKAMSVIDASPDNDWTSVKVQYAGTHGRENPTYGFIYPHAVPVSLGEAVAAAETDKPRVPDTEHVAAETRRHEATDDKDAAAQPDPASRHIAMRAKHHEGTNEQEATAQPGPGRHVAERAKHPKSADEQEVAAQPDPAPRHVAVHVSHRKAAPPHDEAQADPSARPAQRLAAATPAHHKHKDTRLAYVLY